MISAPAYPRPAIGSEGGNWGPSGPAANESGNEREVNIWLIKKI
jgi:hypothetical protein